MTKGQKNNLMKKVMSGMIIVLALLAGIWAVDAHFVTKEYHELCMDKTTKAIQGIQKQTQIQRTYDKLYYWQKMEMEIRLMLAKYPDDPGLLEKLNKTLLEIGKAEAELKRLQSIQ
ncbi:MAG: hypothetical protein ABID54_00425 [Pseudomonadota bacterium]